MSSCHRAALAPLRHAHLIRDPRELLASYARDSVRASAGFAAYRPPAEPLPARLEPLAARCLPYFERLHRYRLTTPGGPDAAGLR